MCYIVCVGGAFLDNSNSHRKVRLISMRMVPSSKPAKGTIKNVGEKTVNFKYKQFDSLAELVSDAGNEAALVAWANGKVRGAVKQTVVNAINSGDPAVGEEKILADAVDAGNSWSIANARQRGTGVTAKAQALDGLLARYKAGEAIDPAEFAALAAQFGA